MRLLRIHADASHVGFDPTLPFIINAQFNCSAWHTQAFTYMLVPAAPPGLL
jgi:hypothetical protein